jgi:hypothetical protein
MVRVRGFIIDSTRLLTQFCDSISISPPNVARAFSETQPRIANPYYYLHLNRDIRFLNKLGQ